MTYATRRPNAPLQAFVGFLRSHPSCKARLHWGKAGWPAHARCFDGAKEYGTGWCHFGCAVRRLDAANKFSGQSDVWAWTAADRRSGAAVADFGACCGGADGRFDEARCTCAPRPACS